MTDNSDLVAFVRARLDEEEDLARAAGGERWRCPTDVPGEIHDRSGAIAFTLRAHGHDYDRHIARQDPARTLQRIETHRVLLDEYAEVAALDVDRPQRDFASGRAFGLGFAVRQLAAENAGHPDYQVKWLPRFIQ
ncbi:DUF6221 family protein [Streptomyces sp. OfavH-34-F]|uniref:DUF6221 family protein n=1 Tax=Streptomyces sp. OfavH-34-F TaxID=2917760 RepID=UPI001EF25A81|nr:DUF6221 family protein [Streptomyces sp. OfavH-34-F]MCG7524675.1 DUF6221 family protein [Streptomyces sp. OfavH-34-F]